MLGRTAQLQEAMKSKKNTAPWVLTHSNKCLSHPSFGQHWKGPSLLRQNGQKLETGKPEYTSGVIPTGSLGVWAQ